MFMCVCVFFYTRNREALRIDSHVALRLPPSVDPAVGNGYLIPGEGKVLGPDLTKSCPRENYGL